uniref:Uncharacterized protein n=1 Tax=Shewanella putrefaciens (strain 200) TaxID=399804 RepID=E6XLQ0_SHEP2
MSYIIAFISFEDSTKEFPVQCFRTDIKQGDKVIARRADGKLRPAIIRDLKYLNWDCNGRIECKADEIEHRSDGEIILPKGSPLAYGISTPDVFIKELKSHGWVPVKSKRRQYRTVLGFANSANVAYIFVRKNGVDIQMLPRTDNQIVKPYSMHEISFNEGKMVQHFLAHTTFNLFEGILRFSKSFIENEADLERYFIPQGRSDKRTEELKQQARERQASRNEMLDIYDACSDGNGGPAYLGDGMWISSDGGLHDWGR